jgi:membrane-associated phospholipid phosphatase
LLWLSIVAGASTVPVAIHAQLIARQDTPQVAPRDSTRNFGLRELAIGAAGLTVVSVIDPLIARDLHTGTSAGSLQLDRQFDRFGDATGTIPIIGGIALTGLITRNRALTRAAIRATESVVLADVLVQGSKYIVGRSRPYVDGDLDGYDFHAFGSTSPSFPSGHSANAFALASSLSDAIGKKWATVGLFAIATGTAWARLSEQQHWLSDVVAGAVVGVGSAKFVAGKVHIFGLRAPHFILGPQSAGMGFTF